MGLLGVVACFANKNSEEFKSLMLHQVKSEYSAARLAYLFWKQDVVGSNPTTQTKFKGFLKEFLNLGP